MPLRFSLHELQICRLIEDGIINIGLPHTPHEVGHNFTSTHNVTFEASDRDAESVIAAV